MSGAAQVYVCPKRTGGEVVPRTCKPALVNHLLVLEKSHMIADRRDGPKYPHKNFKFNRISSHLKEKYSNLVNLY